MFYQFRHCEAMDNPKISKNYSVKFNDSPVTIEETRKLISILKKKELRYILSNDSVLYLSNSVPISQLPFIDNDLRIEMQR